jgi:preprotein translocase subunit Sss1
MNEIKSKRQAAQILAKIVANNSFEVREALFESGVDISPNATDRQVIERVIENIGRNTMLQDKLGALSEVWVRGYDHKNATGGNQGFFANPQTQQMLGNTIGQALGFWLGSRREKQQAEAQSNLLTQQQQLTQANADLVAQQLELERLRAGQQPQQQGMSRGVKIALVSILAIGIVGGIIYFVRKKK